MDNSALPGTKVPLLKKWLAECKMHRSLGVPEQEVAEEEQPPQVVDEEEEEEGHDGEEEEEEDPNGVPVNAAAAETDETPALEPEEDLKTKLTRKTPKPAALPQPPKKGSKQRLAPERPLRDMGFSPDLETVLRQRTKRAAELECPEANIDLLVRYLVTSHTATYLPFAPAGTAALDMYTKPNAIVCHWCTEPFDNVGYPMCRRVRSDPGQYVAKAFVVQGLYCSPACALAHAFEKFGNYTHTRLMLAKVYGVRYVHTRDDGKRVPLELRPAPHPLSLQKFGGPLSTEAFRATGKLGIPTRLSDFPMIPHQVGVEEIERVETCYLQVADSAVVKALREDDQFMFINTTKNRLTARNNDQNNDGPGPGPKKGPPRKRKRATASSRAWSSASTPAVAATAKRDASHPSVRSLLEASTKSLSLERVQVDSVIHRSSRKPNLLNFMKKVQRDEPMPPK